MVRTLAKPTRFSPLEQCRQQRLQPLAAQSGHSLGGQPTHVAVAVVQGIDQRGSGKRIGDAAERLGCFPAHVRFSMRKDSNERRHGKLSHRNQCLSCLRPHRRISICQIRYQRRDTGRPLVCKVYIDSLGADGHGFLANTGKVVGSNTLYASSFTRSFTRNHARA